jgi:hypothetical protein
LKNKHIRIKNNKILLASKLKVVYENIYQILIVFPSYANILNSVPSLFYNKKKKKLIFLVKKLKINMFLK